jgi:uncharacterized protein (DUF488 family)
MARVPDLQLPNDPLDVQHQNKADWNEARRLVQADFFTVGYMRRDIRAFLAVVAAAGVSTVVDVRHTPVSMYKPDFSKGNLSRHLEAVGIAYLHMRNLGVPRDIRSRAAGKSTRDAIWEWYDEHVIPSLSLHAFFNSADHPVALLCMELDPTACHRHRLALALERLGLRGFDL